MASHRVFHPKGFGRCSVVLSIGLSISGCALPGVDAPPLPEFALQSDATTHSDGSIDAHDDGSRDLDAVAQPDDSGQRPDGTALTDSSVQSPIDDMGDTSESALDGHIDDEDAATMDSELTRVDMAPSPPDAMVAPPVNLLDDPGFEEGSARWGIWGGARRVRSNSNEGQWALRATETNGAEQLVDGLTPNTTYRLSGWARVEGDAPIFIGVKDHGNPERGMLYERGEYAYQSMTFTTGLAADSATIYVYKHGGGGAGHADDLELVFEAPGTLELAWSDEFDGDGPPDPQKWTFEEGFRRNEEAQWYQRENAFRENGLLVIEARRERRPNPGHVAGSDDWRTNRQFIEYTSASINTRDLYAFRYGRIAVRAKVTNDVGTWPAIWTLGVECEWPSNGEIDIMENYGGQILANFAWGSDRRWQPVWDVERLQVDALDPDWTDSFHVWELAWNADRMMIFLDGKMVNRVELADTINGTAACEGERPFQQPHYLLLNLALGGNGGQPDQLDFPARYLVDYVRVYQEAE